MEFCSRKKPIHNWWKEMGGWIKRNYIFLHGKSCGVAIGYIGSNKVDILDKKMIKRAYFNIRC